MPWLTRSAAMSASPAAVGLESHLVVGLRRGGATRFRLGGVADGDHRLDGRGAVQPDDLGNVLFGATLLVVLAETYLYPAAAQAEVVRLQMQEECGD